MEIVILSILVFINGFFALSEIAVVSAKPARLQYLKSHGSKGAAVALKLQADTKGFLSAIQVGITLISIVTGVYGGTSIAEDIVPLLMLLPHVGGFANELAIVLAVVLITYLSIVVGELVPKTIALTRPEKIASKVAPTILFLSKVLFPFVWLLSASTNAIVKLTGIKKQDDRLTENELRQIIKTASNEGVIEEEQNEIHEKLFYFSDKRAYHIMTHRTDVEWIDLNLSTTELKKAIKECKHSKIICCDGSIDNFVGVMNLIDYYKTLQSTKSVDLKKLIKEPYIVPEKVDAQRVLNELRKKENQICFVVNEYGGFEGIITMYDILENLIGEMHVEGENSEPDIFEREDGSFLVNGDAPIETLTSIIDGFEIDFSETEYTTVAGFVLSKLNRFPMEGEKFSIHNYTFEVIDMDGTRIDKLLLSKN